MLLIGVYCWLISDNHSILGQYHSPVNENTSCASGEVPCSLGVSFWQEIKPVSSMMADKIVMWSFTVCMFFRMQKYEDFLTWQNIVLYGPPSAPVRPLYGLPLKKFRAGASALPTRGAIGTPYKKYRFGQPKTLCRCPPAMSRADVFYCLRSSGIRGC